METFHSYPCFLTGAMAGTPQTESLMWPLAHRTSHPCETGGGPLYNPGLCSCFATVALPHVFRACGDVRHLRLRAGNDARPVPCACYATSRLPSVCSVLPRTLSLLALPLWQHSNALPCGAVVRRDACLGCWTGGMIPSPEAFQIWKIWKGRGHFCQAEVPYYAPLPPMLCGLPAST